MQNRSSCTLRLSLSFSSGMQHPLSRSLAIREIDSPGSFLILRCTRLLAPLSLVLRLPVARLRSSALLADGRSVSSSLRSSNFLPPSAISSHRSNGIARGRPHLSSPPPLPIPFATHTVSFSSEFSFILLDSSPKLFPFILII